MADKTLDELRKKRAMLRHLIAMDIQSFPDTLKSPVQVQGETDELHDALGVALAACERQIEKRVEWCQDRHARYMRQGNPTRRLEESAKAARAELARHETAMKEQG